MAADSDLGLLFFVVAIMYLVQMIIVVWRTAWITFDWKKYPNERPMKVFRAFYGSLAVQTILNSALYWVLFNNQVQDNKPAEETDSGYKSVVLIYIPSILMSFNYALIYLQLEDMQLRARSSGGIAYIRKENQEKIQKIMNIITFVYIISFMVVQLGMLVLTVFDYVQPNEFLVEFNVLIFFMVVLVNINALSTYCRNAGNPYLNDKCKRYVR